MRIAEVRYYTEGGKNRDQHLRAQVALRDQTGTPVSGATVALTLNRNGAVYYPSSSQTTGSDGTVTFRFQGIPEGCYTELLTVTHQAFGWDGVTPMATPSDPFCK
jgi:hypothetical protein